MREICPSLILKKGVCILSIIAIKKSNFSIEEIDSVTSISFVPTTNDYIILYGLSSTKQFSAAEYNLQILWK